MKKKAITANKWFKELESVGPFPPYSAPPLTLKTRDTGKVSKELKALRGTPGVYIIRDSSGAARYVGATGYSLYTSVLRRFQEWTSNTKDGDFAFDRVTYNPREEYTAEVIPMPKQKANIWRVEDYYIGKLKPSDNKAGLFGGKTETETEAEYYERIEREEKEAEEMFLSYAPAEEVGELIDENPSDIKRFWDYLKDTVVPF